MAEHSVYLQLEKDQIKPAVIFAADYKKDHVKVYVDGNRLFENEDYSFDGKDTVNFNIDVFTTSRIVIDYTVEKT
ncbi:hypothetical protein OQX61_11970 [Pedobacter sp. PLR]|uniref:hypothetical protein n=1 Tax=Pedobacter sp. PLR TaxID=2994465 RepID=UPI0022480EE7|nr:hypothetical protein [Pedobacter sp. PLR]MCX2451980.1 hypothetical protein [Pedobacter sp. PLR]